MASETEALKGLYKKIAVLEMVEKLKNCGLVWNSINPYQYHTVVIQDEDVWDLYLTKMQEKVILDLRKNTLFFYSMNSEEESDLINMFDEITGDEAYQKDKTFLSDIQQAESC
jgi:hypothetical protein